MALVRNLNIDFDLKAVTNEICVRSKILAVVKMTLLLLWVVMPC